MKWMRFFLLLFLIPSLIYAEFDQEDYAKRTEKINSEWKRHEELVQQFHHLDPTAKEQGIYLLKEAIACCQRATGHCDYIIENIRSMKPKPYRRAWAPAKENRRKDKKALENEITQLQNLINRTLAFGKASSLYQESLKKAEQADIKNQNCHRRLSNVEEVLSNLTEVCKLYEEALALVREALHLITPYSDEVSNNTLRETIESYQAKIDRYKKEAAEWPATVLAQKAALEERASALKEDRKLFEENDLRRSSYEIQKQLIPILEQLIEGSLDDEKGALKKELVELKDSIASFERESDLSRLTQSTSSLSEKEFMGREKERREFFFKNNFLLTPALFLQSIAQNRLQPFTLSLDGYVFRNGNDFTLYTEQFYRFLVQSNTSISQLIVKVYGEGEVIHEERIALPLKNSMAWERYLTIDGMTFIPETKLKTQFGIDLRLNFVYDSKFPFSMIIAQKGVYSNYLFSISFDEGEPLYACRFAMPPPWQLGILRKPDLPYADRPIGRTTCSENISLSKESDRQLALSESITYPILDQLIEEFKKDPLALASYVYHEIAFVDPFLHQENGIFYAPSIHRNALRTYLEKKGSPWEQCQLLVYLLRKAGYPAFYAAGGISSLPKRFIEKLLLIKLPEDQKEALVQYPLVIFFDGKEWISLFPWMKEMHIEEGYDLYSLMPEEYSSADRWILRYLKGDKSILKWIGPDQDDTAGILFVRFVEEQLRQQGLSLSDVGIHRIQLKKQFYSWKDFLRPSNHTNASLLISLNPEKQLFAKALIEISSHENPQKRVSHLLHLADIDSTLIPIRFSTQGKNQHQLRVQFKKQEEPPLNLDESDCLINVKISYELPLGSQFFQSHQTLSIAKGTSAALCFHFGGPTPKLTSQFYHQFSSEKDEKERIPALLAFVGASYFDKCGYAEKILADLHKINPTTAMAFGLAKLSPDISKGPFKGEEELILPQVDMFWFHFQPSSHLDWTTWHQENQTARRQFQSLALVNQSSNEHQILREVFKGPYAVSTVKLLQLAHLQQQKKGLEGEGFLILTPSSLEAAEKTPEAAQSLYFSHLKDLNLRPIQTEPSGQWKAASTLLGPDNPLSSWAYAYMTPGLTSNQDGSYTEIGTLIFHPHTQYALISNNNLLFHGGLGSPLPVDYLTPFSISQWQLVPSFFGYDTSRYTLQVSSSVNPNPTPPLKPSSSPGTTQYSSDVRPEHKSFISYVSDPVDVITGAFYIDEVDLVLPGPFPLEIRRNYNSQNPLIGDLGVGWKLSLNPYLIEQDGKLYAAEADGTVIAYSYNHQIFRWEVFPEDNPDLSNFNQKGIGSTSNPFHAYIENDILYGSDGSKRIFKEGLLQQWINAKGNTLTFFYNDRRLSRIESSNGDFCGLHYNHEGKISEIYAKDGRRISYSYNSQGDLIKIILPNTAVISYEYDHKHRIIRETKPHGKVLENIYKEGKVKEQRSPMGLGQAMTTTAIFDYQDGLTTVTDAKEGRTTYKIFQKQIYKVIDPLGFQMLYSWFVDEKSWFDPITEQVMLWNQPGGATRCLKESTDKRGLTTYYLYDSRGNPVEIGLKGEDLTGNGVSLIAKKLVYNDLNLCIQEEVCGQRTIMTYDSAFPYLPKRIEKYSGSNCISYVELGYNSQGLVEKEDHSGSITLWEYDARGFPRQKIQITNTDDPDVITTYSYNNQGQCIELRTADGVQESDYDIMGNQIESKMFSPSGTLLSATYTGYDLNNAPIWKQTANPNNTLYLDYHASGLIKATRRTSTPAQAVAYTLYEYDPRGYLIEEVDPLGYTTYRDYDALGKVTCETKEGLSTFFTYEPGGLVETITSPSGSKTTRLYTTNGLLKEEIYPDGTRSSIIYDFFGRPTRETKNGITWEITYDDSHHRVIRTNIATEASEIRELDARGNLIRFTDAAGYTSEKRYDGLNRLKTETSPSGQQTVWNYQGDTFICTLPSGEKRVQRYEGGRVVESEVVDAQGNLIASSSYHYDPETDIQEVIQGDEVTTTWMNTLGLPIKVQKGNITTTYEYDLCGNCIAITDGDGRTTRQTFDGLRRMVQKELADGSIIGYIYDLDSNLAEYHLPNGTVWKAFYNSMRRKIFEELQAGMQSSQRWEYAYENGYLKEAKDPLQRIHTYLYDLNGRLTQESVDGWQRIYTYDPRGLLSSAEQIGAQSISWLSSWFYSPRQEHSKVERSYDADGRLILETIYLNSDLIQQTKQTWEASSRSLQINDHTRDFFYKNSQLTAISTQDMDLSYTYDLSGSLRNKSTPLTTTTTDYNSSGLPENIHTRIADRSYQESLNWTPSGKLSAYLSSKQQKRLSYTNRGYLESAGEERYEFDFGAPGIGVRTDAPGSIVPQNGLDAFGRVVTEMGDNSCLVTNYNPMGQVISRGARQFEWDPWGRLLKVSDEAFTWEASYDALGRRLQTRYTPSGSPTLTTTSLFDPEEEFQEIGVKYGNKTFWKIYGPNSCDAITDETGTCVVLVHNALGQLAAAVLQHEVFYSKEPPSSYGPQSTAPSIPTDLLSYAQSLAWHSQAQDPTGLIWMGTRYYDPKGGRFLSPDPVGYPICLDLYAYASGDPVNYIDPDGRFASLVYQTIEPAVISAFQPLRGLNQASLGFNAFSAYCANNGLTRSNSFEVGSFDLPNTAIGFINGINNVQAQSIGSAQQLSQYAQGAKIHGIYNATNWDSSRVVSTVIDILECGLGHMGLHTPPVQLLKNQWNHFIATYGPEAKFLQICHSGGADHVRNALLTSPEWVRQKIIVLAIAPSVIIPEELCFQSYNYISRRDFVTHLDVIGKLKYGNQLQILEPHPNANLWDHEFLSPTFAPSIQYHITNHLKYYGGNK